MGDDKQFTAWITRYALTQGIFKKTVEGTRHASMVSSVGDRYTSCYHGNDWHRTEAAAIRHAKTMRAKKIVALKKQIAKLEALRFGVDK